MTTQRQTAKMARRLARIIEEHDGDAFEVSRSIEEAPKRYALGEPTLRGSDVTWAQQFRPDRKGQTDG